jgi:UDP-3-O-[3-hydroxymyristoyl] glucosamine N-acyltransferase
MNKKYKLTKNEIFYGGKRLFQIQALRDFKNTRYEELDIDAMYETRNDGKYGFIHKDDLGGFIEKEENLSQDGNAWVSQNAKVYDNARIFGDAFVSGNANIYGDSQIYDNACVYGDASIFNGKSRIYGNAKVKDYAGIQGNVQIYGNALIAGNADIRGNAQVYGDTAIYDRAWVDDNAQVCGNARVSGDSGIHGELKLESGHCLATIRKKDSIIKEIDNGNEILVIEEKALSENVTNKENIIQAWKKKNGKS